jgi:hypothetical protein
MVVYKTGTLLGTDIFGLDSQTKLFNKIATGGETSIILPSEFKYYFGKNQIEVIIEGLIQYINEDWSEVEDGLSINLIDKVLEKNEHVQVYLRKNPLYNIGSNDTKIFDMVANGGESQITMPDEFKFSYGKNQLEVNIEGADIYYNDGFTEDVNGLTINLINRILEKNERVRVYIRNIKV